MSQAQVTDIEVVRDFRAAILNFCEEARDALAAVDMKTRKAMEWVGHTQFGYWSREIRNRDDELSQAKAALFRKQLSGFGGEKPDTYEEQKAVRRAQERLKEAEDKTRKCRQWATDLPRRIDEYVGMARQLALLVDVDPVPAAAFLERVLGSLDAYTELRAPTIEAPGAGPSAAGPPTAGTQAAAAASAAAPPPPAQGGA